MKRLLRRRHVSQSICCWLLSITTVTYATPCRIMQVRLPDHEIHPPESRHWLSWTPVDRRNQFLTFTHCSNLNKPCLGSGASCTIVREFSSVSSSILSTKIPSHTFILESDFCIPRIFAIIPFWAGVSHWNMWRAHPLPYRSYLRAWQLSWRWAWVLTSRGVRFTKELFFLSWGGEMRHWCLGFRNVNENSLLEIGRDV